MKKTVKWLFASVLTIAFFLTSCGKPPDAEKVINIAFTTAWGGFNPYSSGSETMYELSLYDKIFDKLAFTDMAGAEILPRAADSWESADDGYSAVFHLNPNAAWSDGEPATAMDWLFTVNLLADPASTLTTRVFTSILAGTDENGVRIDGEAFRSEERRVGKECRSRWSPYH